MGAKTKEVGGGPATGLADDFISMLRNGLKTGSFGNATGLGGGSSYGGPTVTNPNQPVQVGQTTAGDALSRSNPVGSTQGIGDVLDQFLNGNFGNRSYGVDTSGLKGMVGDGYKFDSSNLPDFSKFNIDASQSPYSSNITTNPLFTSALSQLKSSIGGADIGPQKTFSTTTINTPGVDAYNASLDRQKMKDIADLRARFGASGGSAFGTPAAYAEGNYAAEATATNAAKLADVARSDAGLKLQQELETGKINADQYKTYLNALVQSQGNQISGSSNLAGVIASALGTEGNQNLTARGQDIDAILRSAGVNLDAMKAGSSQALDTNKIQSDAFAQNKGLNIDALSKALGIDLSGQQLGENARQFNVGEQGNTLAGILNTIAQLSGKGIAQRQTVTTPGLGQQIIGGLTGIAGAIAPFARGGFGGGGGGTPNVGPLPPSESPTYFPDTFTSGPVPPVDYNTLSRYTSGLRF